MCVYIYVIISRLVFISEKWMLCLSNPVKFSAARECNQTLLTKRALLNRPQFALESWLKCLSWLVETVCGPGSSLTYGACLQDARVGRFSSNMLGEGQSCLVLILLKSAFHCEALHTGRCIFAENSELNKSSLHSLQPFILCFQEDTLCSLHKKISEWEGLNVFSCV